MARIRTIKPEFWTSEQVMECSPIARLLFIGLWNFCDDGGNHPASAKTLKAEVFPGDDISAAQVQTMLAELSANGLLAFYEHEGKEYIHVTGWQHQKIEKPTYKHPKFEAAKEGAKPASNGGMQPAAQSFDNDSANARRTVVEESPNALLPLDPGMEGKGIGEEQDQKLSPQPPKGEAGPQPEPKPAAAPVIAKPAKSDAMEGFAEFWMRYPKKKSKVDAEKAWAKLKPNAELRAEIMTALGQQVRSHDWTKNAGQYIPLPATWLNGRRWQDESPQEASQELFSRHHGFADRDYTAGLKQREDGTYGF